MFLKSEQFDHNGHQVTLYELSALQRIEHFQYLAQQEASLPKEDDSDPDKLYPIIVAMSIRDGARLVAMSLWHDEEHKGKTAAEINARVEALQSEIMATWPVDAIGLAETKVKTLSGMIHARESVLPEENEEAKDASREQHVESEKLTAEKR